MQSGKDREKGLWLRFGEWLLEVIAGVIFIWLLLHRLECVFSFKYGFLPWLYKEEWGGGWKKLLFMAGYAVAETGLVHLLVILSEKEVGWLFYSCVYVFFLFWAILPNKDKR